jgi:hypothetical protein
MCRDNEISGRPTWAGLSVASVAKPEVWQRGPLPSVDPLLMPVAHALVQVQEDLQSSAATIALPRGISRPEGESK